MKRTVQKFSIERWHTGLSVTKGLNVMRRSKKDLWAWFMNLLTSKPVWGVISLCFFFLFPEILKISPET